MKKKIHDDNKTLSEGNKILDFNQYQKSYKHHLLFMQIRECITEKIDGCKYNPEKLSTTKVSEHIQSGFSMPTISSFRSAENMDDVYKGKGCMKKLSEFLIRHAMKIIN